MPSQNSYLLHILDHIKILLATGGVVAVAAMFLALIIFPLRYGAGANILIINTATIADPYTTVKSAERIGENLAAIVGTSQFLNAVQESPYEIDRAYFKNDERQRRKQWNNMIETSVVTNSSLLHIQIYHEEKDQAVKIAQAVASTILNKGHEYVGSQVQFKLVDAPIASRFPQKPNIFMALVLGFIFGVAAGAVYVLTTTEKRHKGFLEGLE
ncbi:MAG: hypothetical protein HW383_535 [Candidatus Magasanikbacteria bacterium]|nr:hypothetical protein [Candidatus Magasanikbacteria bacterium]